MHCLSRCKAAGAVLQLGVILNATILTCAVLLQCCTCDLCGCGSVFEFIFAAAGTAWCAMITHHSDSTHPSTKCKPLSFFQKSLSQERELWPVALRLRRSWLVGAGGQLLPLCS